MAAWLAPRDDGAARTTNDAAVRLCRYSLPARRPLRIALLAAMGELGKRPRGEASGGGGGQKRPKQAKDAAPAAASAKQRRPAPAPAAPPAAAPPPPRAGKAVAVSANWAALKVAIGAGRGAPQRDPGERRPAPVGNDRRRVPPRSTAHSLHALHSCTLALFCGGSRCTDARAAASAQRDARARARLRDGGHGP